MSRDNSPAEILRGALVKGGLGVLRSKTPKTAWPIFVGHMPNEPDSAICVYDTGGDKDGRIMKTGESIIHPGWQIRVRAPGHPEAYAKMNAIRKFIDTIRKESVVIGQDTYIIDALMLTSGPFSLGQETDGKRREIFTVNGTMTIALT